MALHHHFKSNQDFALQVVHAYTVEVHQGLHARLSDDRVPPYSPFETSSKPRAISTAKTSSSAARSAASGKSWPA
ncbi:MAG: hypothetical protein ACI9MC_002510 [Kiritimatiellia bacterium]|jgi:hypothetical protein